MQHRQGLWHLNPIALRSLGMLGSPLTRWLAVAVFCASPILAPSPAHGADPHLFNALQVGQLPNQVNPGQLSPLETPEEKQIQQQLQKKEPEEVRLELPKQAPTVQMQSPQFFCEKINITGNSLFSQKDLAPLAQPFEKRLVTLEELGKLVEGLNTYYRKRGYLTTQAYIPPQDVENGMITIHIVEGRLGEIEISGNKYHQSWAIKRFLGHEPGQPLNIAKLEKNILRMNRFQDYMVKATLAAGEKTGETDIRLEVSERQPFQVSATVDNQGRPFIGTYRWGVEMSDSSLLGLGDQLYTRWLSSVGTQVAIGSYNVPLNRFGTAVNANFVYSHVGVDVEIPNPPEIDGASYNYGLSVSQPLDPDRVFSVDTGLNFRRISSYFERVKTNQDDIRSISFGLNFNKADRFGRTSMRFSNTFGPSWFMASDEQRFWKTEANLTRVVRLPKNNVLIVRGNMQLTPDALPSAEQYQIGGAYSVRGYTEGLLSGDRGYTIGVEHRYPIPFLGMVSPWLSDRIQGTTFFDLGQAWLDTSNVNYVRGFSHRNKQTLLVAAGVGVRAQLTRFVSGFVDMGFGLADRGREEPNAQPTVRVHFGLRSDLLPETVKSRGQNVTHFKNVDGKVIKTKTKREPES